MAEEEEEESGDGSDKKKAVGESGTQASKCEERKRTGDRVVEGNIDAGVPSAVFSAPLSCH